MLTVKESYEKLLKSKEFKHEKFLCSILLISDINNIEKAAWQIDFYNEDSDTVNTYTIGDEVEASPESKIFKDGKTKIERLQLDEVKTDFNEIYDHALDILKKHKENAVKVIIILQKQKHVLWNILFITKGFNILNIKIDAEDGKVIEEKITSFVKFEK